MIIIGTTSQPPFFYMNRLDLLFFSIIWFKKILGLSGMEWGKNRGNQN